MIAVPDGGERTVVHPEGWTVPSPYSYGIKAATPCSWPALSHKGKDNARYARDITAQTRTVLDNGAAILSRQAWASPTSWHQGLHHRRGGIPGDERGMPGPISATHPRPASR